MTKLLKKYTLTALSAVFAISVASALSSSVEKANADVAPLTVAQLDEKNTFTMQNGASIRLDGEKAIRFSADMPAEDYAGLVAEYGEENVSFGTFILPAIYVEGHANSKGAPSEATCFGENAVYTWNKKEDGKLQILHTVADVSLIASTESVCGYVRNILDPNLNISYLGYSYLKVTQAEGDLYLFADQTTDNARSTLMVACNALDSGNYTESSEDYADITAYFTQYQTYCADNEKDANFNYTITTKLDGEVASTETKSGAIYSTVSATPSAQKGYAFSEEGSTLTGKVYPNGSLNLVLNYVSKATKAWTAAEGKTELYAFAKDLATSATFATTNVASDAYNLVLPEAVGEVDYLTVGGVDITDFSYDNGTQTLTVPAADLANATVGDTTIVVESATTVYTAPVLVADVVIETSDELATVRSMATTTYYGYVAMNKDITTPSGFFSAVSTADLCGTFDGRNHTINALASTYAANGGSLFFRLRGTVKNLSLKAQFGGGSNGGLCQQLKGGRIENVYLSVNPANQAYSGGLVMTVDSSTAPAQIINSVVYVNGTTRAGLSGSMFLRGYNGNEPTITNSYVVDATSTLIAGSNASNFDSFYSNVNALPILYRSTALFFDAVYAGVIDVDTEKLAKIGVTDTDARIVVSTADQLVAAFKETTSQEKRSAKIVLANNIDMNDLTGGNSAITPIAVFSGRFNGNGYSISNLTLKYGGGNGTGMFTQMNEGTICNVALINVQHNSTVKGTQYGATIAGGMRASTVDNVYISTNISNAGENSGGVLGWVNTSTTAINITNCVINVITNTQNTTHGAIIGKSGNTSPVNFKGTYIIVSADTVNSTGSNFSSVLSNDATKHTLDTFKTAGIDFSGYNVAVQNAVNGLING